METMVYTVTQVNNEIKSMLEDHLPFRNIFVQGEISNYKLHSSGHHYMTLKDEGSVLSAIFFRYQAQRLRVRLKNGMKVIARGRISSFPKSGQYQLYISDLILDGVGDLHIAFEQLKQKLYQEGLFDPELKKGLPRFPETIAVVTSPTGAAIRDMIRILGSRYPLADIRLYPVQVQGEDAAESICKAIDFINNEDIADLIITGRGGGSIEDLWAFNEECVARTIFASNIPVISAVGHEPDVTISDFVADVRASTPSNAAELAVPGKQAIFTFLEQAREVLKKQIIQVIQEDHSHLTLLKNRLLHQHPQNQINEKRMHLDILIEKFQNLIQNILQDSKSRLGMDLAKLDALSPIRVLARGYALAEHKNGKVITDAASLHEGDSLRIQFYHGSVDCKVEKIEIKGIQEDVNGKSY